MNPFQLFVSPEDVFSKLNREDAPVGRIHSISPTGSSDESFFRKKTWEVPGVGTVNRQEVMDAFGLTRRHLLSLVTKANKDGLPLIWFGLLQLFLEHPTEVVTVARGPTLSSLQMKDARETYGLGVVDLAHLTGYSSTSISRWESISNRLAVSRNYQILCALMQRVPQLTFTAFLRQAEQMPGFSQQRLRSLRLRLIDSGGLEA